MIDPASNPRRFSSEEIETGIAVLGKREDSCFLREFLMRELFAVCGSTNPCALSMSEGRRSLAAIILRLLDRTLDNDRPDAGRTFGSNSIRAGFQPSGTESRVPAEPPGGYGRGPRPAGSRKPRNKA
jgi:hypothetical protein